MSRKTLFSDGEDAIWKKDRGTQEADLDITPMIDVTFLLLIFFMVTSTMQPQKEFEVPPAKYGVGVETRDALMIEVHADPQGTPAIVLGGVESSLDGVTPFVQTGFDEEKTHVVIKADRDVPHGFVQRVTRKVIAVEGVTFSIGVREKTE